MTQVEPEAPVPPKGAGVAMQPPDAEAPVPPKGAGVASSHGAAETCPNCGKVGTMEDAAELPTGEEEQD